MALNTKDDKHTIDEVVSDADATDGDATDGANGLALDGDREPIENGTGRRSRSSLNSDASHTVTTSSEVPLLARWAGALLVAAALFALAATMAFGSVGRQSVWGWAFLVLGFLSLAGWFMGRRQGEQISRDSHARQRVLLGTNAIASVLLFLVLLVGVNYIATRRHKVFDLTSNRVNSLAEQSYKALEQLPGPVKLTYVFFPRDRSGQPDPMASSLLNSYRNASDKVRVEFLDASKDPAKVESLGLSTSARQMLTGQTVILAELEETKKDGKTETNATGQNRQEITVADEQNVTTALMRLVNPKPRIVYFLTGHGEAPPEGPESTMSRAKAVLEAQNITIQTLSLARTKNIPADAGALIVVAPQVDLTTAEEKTLNSYMDGKGRLLLLLAPGQRPLPRWRALIKKLGIEVQDGIVLDPTSMQPQVVRGVPNTNAQSPILRGVSGDVVFPAAVPLRIANQPPPGSPQPPGSPTPATALFESSPESQVVVPGKQASSQPGAVTLAVAVERGGSSMPGTPPGATPDAADAMRAVVVGNFYFVTDQFVDALGNSSFLTSAVNWVIGADKTIAIPPKPPVTNSVTMTTPTLRFVILFSLLAMPLLAILLGGVVWWKRR